VSPPHDADAAAEALGGFLRALHFAAPPDAPANQFRGVALAARDDAMRTRVVQLAAELDADAVLRLWSEVLSCPVDGPVCGCTETSTRRTSSCTRSDLGGHRLRRHHVR
jgi:hypothetical protein